MRFRGASLWRRLWREPLTRFFAVGAGLFLVYAVVGTHSPADDHFKSEEELFNQSVTKSV